jgi:hypothetical protein
VFQKYQPVVALGVLISFAIGIRRPVLMMPFPKPEVVARFGIRGPYTLILAELSGNAVVSDHVCWGLMGSSV